MPGKSGNRQKVLLIGGGGLLGSALYRVCSSCPACQVTGTCRDGSIPGLFSCDLEKPGEAAGLIALLKPETVFLTAALTHVDYCETHPEKARRVNVGGVEEVVRACEKLHAKLVFLSSEYIFDGKDGPYDEEAPAAPLNVYGRTKLQGEKIIQSSLAEFLIIRTTVLYGWAPETKNYLHQVVNRLKAGKTIKAPADQISNPTYHWELAWIIHRLHHLKATGVFNCVGRERLSRAEFARKIARAFSLPAELILEVPTAFLGQKANRPLNAGLRTEKLEKYLGRKMLGPDQGLFLSRRAAKQSGPGFLNITGY